MQEKDSEIKNAVVENEEESFVHNDVETEKNECVQNDNIEAETEACVQNDGIEAETEACVQNDGMEAETEACVQNDSIEAEVEPVKDINEKEEEILLIEIMKTLEVMDEKMEKMNQLFIQKIQHTTHEEKILDQMHAELQKYKEDMYSQLIRPVLLDVIEIRDSIIRMSKSFAAKPEGEQSVPLKTFSDYAFDMQDILEKNNIIIYDSKDGDDFNALKHRAIKKVFTSEEQLHGKIAESLSSGYDYQGRAISPEKVAVYIYQQPKEAEGEN